MESESEDRYAVEQSQLLSRRILDELNTYWSSQPNIVLHALFDITGALASAMITHDGARLEWVLGLTDALRAHIVRDAALLKTPGKES